MPPTFNSGQALFLDRLLHTGKLPEFSRRVEEYVAQGIPRGQAKWKVMKEMGYLGPKAEAKLAPTYQLKTIQAASEIKLSQHHARQDAAIAMTEYQKVFNSLPNKAAPEAEVEWVASHPLMDLALSDPDAKITITAEDLESPVNGRAPSKQAVISLRRWLKDPELLQSELLKEAKKQVADKDVGPTREADDPGIEEIARMLKEMA